MYGLTWADTGKMGVRGILAAHAPLWCASYAAQAAAPAIFLVLANAALSSVVGLALLYVVCSPVAVTPIVDPPPPCHKPKSTAVPLHAPPPSPSPCMCCSCCLTLPPSRAHAPTPMADLQ
jgi:hypothetical protein